MASNKNAQIRYRVLDTCFSNPRKKYFIEDLIEACDRVLLEIDPKSGGIRRRQIFDDIRHMESSEGWSAPVERLKDGGKRVYYRYSDARFSIGNQPLNQAELEQIRSAMQILSRFKGMPQFEWVNELSPKMEQAFTLEKSNQPIISFDNNQYLKGIEYLGPLFHSILYKQTLCLRYQSFKRDAPKQYLIHPYYLKQHNNRWFLLGLSDEFKTLSTFALDRIIATEDSEITYLENVDYDFEEYFEDVIGVTVPRGAKPELIKLSFDRETSPYVLSKPLHGSQKIVSKTSTELVISIEVIINYELETVVLGYSDRVKVLAPDSFRSTILRRLERAVGLYG